MHHHNWRRIAIGLAAVLAASLSLAATASAQTTLQGVTITKRQSPIDSVNQKGIFTNCPTGKTVLSTGGAIFNTNLNAFETVAGFQSLVMEDTLNGVSTTAREFTPTTQTWGVDAVAICAFTPDGYERVSAKSALDSNQKNLSVSCPAGKTAIGPAVRIGGGNGHVVLDDLVPSADHLSYSVAAFEDPTGTPDNWSVTVTTTCVTGQPVAMHRRVATSADDSKTIKTVTASCIAGKVIGVGADITGGTGSVALTGIVPDTVPAQQVDVSAREIGTNVNQNWFLRAYAVCAIAT